MAFFDIIIPVYNVEKYLEDCLESVLGQTFRDFCVILVDDGSTDGSGNICDSYASQDSRVRVIHKKNGGLSSARNAAIPHAEGEYVLFLDSDDYYLDVNVLQILVDRLKETKSDVLVFNSKKDYGGTLSAPYFTEVPNMPGCPSGKETEVFRTEHNIWTACAWNKAVKRSMYDNGELRFREGITSEDIDWCLRLAMAAKRFDYLNLCVVGYRQRPGSITTSVTPGKTRCLLDNICHCLELWKQGGEDPSLKAYLAYQYGTLLVNISQLPGSEERRALEKQAKIMTYLLKWSDQPKIRLLRTANRCVGFPLMLKLLEIKFG